MALTLDLPREVERELEKTAHANGQSIAEFVTAMVASLAPSRKAKPADDGDADLARRLAALRAIGRYDNRARAGLPPLDDTGISRADFYGYTEREDKQL